MVARDDLEVLPLARSPVPVPARLVEDTEDVADLLCETHTEDVEATEGVVDAVIIELAQAGDVILVLRPPDRGRALLFHTTEHGAALLTTAEVDMAAVVVLVLEVVLCAPVAPDHTPAPGHARTGLIRPTVAAGPGLGQGHVAGPGEVAAETTFVTHAPAVGHPNARLLLQLHPRRTAIKQTVTGLLDFLTHRINGYVYHKMCYEL